MDIVHLNLKLFYKRIVSVENPLLKPQYSLIIPESIPAFWFFLIQNLTLLTGALVLTKSHNVVPGRLNALSLIPEGHSC